MRPRFNDVTSDLLNSKGEHIFRLEKKDLEIFLYFFLQGPTLKKQRINTATRKLFEYGNNLKKEKKFEVGKNIYDENHPLIEKLNLPPSKNGLCMDYRGTSYLHSPDASFKIKLMGSRSLDDKIAYAIYFKKMGLTDRTEQLKIMKKYTWHHLDENLEFTFQLVDTKAHSKIPHIGAVEQYKKQPESKNTKRDETRTCRKNSLQR